MSTYPAPATDSRPELITDGVPQDRPRWSELATSPDHKDIGRILVSISLGALFLAALELFLLRLQLSIPENTFLSPVGFDRILTAFGTTGVFFFLIPLVIGLLYYVVPLQIGSRGTALARLGQTGLWLIILGGLAVYGSLLYTPSEAGINPLPPLSELAFTPNNGTDVWIVGTGLAVLGFLFISIDLLTTLHQQRTPGMAWRRMPAFSWAGAIVGWTFAVVAPIFLAGLTMLMIDRHFDGVFFSGSAGGAPLLWQHMSFIFFTAAYMSVAVTMLAAIAEIVPAFSRRPLYSRGGVIGSLVAIQAMGTLAWTQNMTTAPIGSGWKYYAMLMCLALIVPFGLVFFNLIATMVGGAIRMRGPLRWALGALSLASIGLAAEIAQSIVAIGTRLNYSYDAFAATGFALVGFGVFGGIAALHYWYPKMTGRTMGESLSKISFWVTFLGVLVTFLPMFAAGVEGQVTDAYKFFASEGVDTPNLISAFGAFILFVGVVLTASNAVLSRENGPRAGHDPWGGDSLEWFTVSPPPAHNFDVRPDVRSARPMRDIRDAIAKRQAAGSTAGSRAAREPQSIA